MKRSAVRKIRGFAIFTEIKKLIRRLLDLTLTLGEKIPESLLFSEVRFTDLSVNLRSLAMSLSSSLDHKYASSLKISSS